MMSTINPRKDRNFKVYQELMPHRVQEILVVSSAYDAFIMEEDGGLLEHVYMSYRGVSLVNPPRFKMVTTVREAQDCLKRKRYDLVVIMPRNLELDVVTFGREVKLISPKSFVVILAHNAKGLTDYACQLPKDAIDKLFVWSGNRSIMWAILKWVEDKLNVVHDTETAMVRVIILVEDSPYYYSSLLPLLTEAVVQQTQEVLEDGLNEEHRLLKLRARPKILLASCFEEAMEYFNQFRPYVLSILSDVRFPRAGVVDEAAGIELLKQVKREFPLLPILLLSSEDTNKEKAESVRAHFLDKNSPSLHHEVLQYFSDCLGFGDFIFRLSNGDEVARAHNLISMETILQTVPDESLVYHASSGHHFSNWLMARSQIGLASRIRAATYESFANVDEIRKFLIDQIRRTRILQRKGIVGVFRSYDFDPESEFLKIGDGSLGGKARGLAFMGKCIQNNIDHFTKFKNITVTIPRTLVLATDCYDHFIQDNGLEDFAKIKCADEIVASRFLEAKISPSIEQDLMAFLKKVRYPLAVRSSSLLEDSQTQPFAGLYKTYMLPNNHPDVNERLRQLSRAIKLIYASVFYNAPKAFAKTTMHRTEEEKMAISIQELKGKFSGDYYYPTFSGTAQSHNYYPVGHMRPEEGSAQIAVGLGKTVVEGGNAIRFSPKYPKYLPQFSNIENTLKNAQRYFFALKTRRNQYEASELWIRDDINLEKREILDATDEAQIISVTSTYLPEEHKIVDSKLIHGVPVVTYASILKYDFVQLPELLTLILQIGKEGLGCEVEVEFAMNLNEADNKKHEFVLLQVRPLTTNKESIAYNFTEDDIKNSICYSTNALGRSVFREITDIIFVKPETFSSTRTMEIVSEISEINELLEKQNRKYLLVGPGRWGSSDRMLGIPVAWNDISGVSGIIEAALDDFKVDPSQGTHFFQNITSLGVIYFTVHKQEDFINWDWFRAQTVVSEKRYVTHITTEKPLQIRIDGISNRGVISIG